MLLVKFLPAMLAIPVALTIGIREGILILSIISFYPLMIAMIFGSMIAGSTPLGGGVVAFPVTVLVLGFTPSQGRDFSLMIQSIGMTAASFVIFTEKRNLLDGHGNMVAGFCFFSIIGLIIGFYVQLSPFIVNMFYTTSVACMAIILVMISFHQHQKQITFDKENESDEPKDDSSENYSDTPNEEEGEGSWTRTKAEENTSCSILRPRSMERRCQETGKNSNMTPAKSNSNKFSFVHWLGLTLSAIAGGFLSSQIGSGADITWYAYGSFLTSSSSSQLLNMIVWSCDGGSTPSSSQTRSPTFSDNSLTAISVVVMACTSVYGTILRITVHNSEELNFVDQEVYHALLACSFIVVFGAPIGSLFLTPTHQNKLKILFYVFAIMQFILFGVIKIRDNVTVWACVTSAILFVCILGVCHHYRCSPSRTKN